MLIGIKHFDHNPDIYNWFIKQWTGAPYVHVEIILETRHNTCVAARTTNNCVSFQNFDTVIPNPEKFEFFRVPVHEADALPWLIEQAGKPFNWDAVIGHQGLKCDLQGCDHWFCSEIAYYLLTHFSTLNIPKNRDPKSLSPAGLRSMLVQAGVAQVPSPQPAKAAAPNVAQAFVMGVASMLPLTSAYGAAATGASGSTYTSAIKKESVTATLLANIENTVAFSWAGRKLVDYQFIETATGNEIDIDITKTAGGFTTVVNQNYTGTFYLFLFNP